MDRFLPLSEAVFYSQTEAVKFLIHKGANLNKISRGPFNTALQTGAINNEFECLDVLLKAGADVNMHYGDGDTVFKAAASGYVSRIHTLVKAGADVNIRNVLGDSALSAAASGTCRKVDQEAVAAETESTKLLFRSEAKINWINQKNINALCSYIEISKTMKKSPDRTMLLLLDAAGERINGITIDEEEENTSCVLDYLDKREINLKELSREAIRNHLLNINRYDNLFARMTKLGLPKILTQYRLFNVSLDKFEHN